jgi:hypothetical protein
VPTNTGKVNHRRAACRVAKFAIPTRRSFAKNQQNNKHFDLDRPAGHDPAEKLYAEGHLHAVGSVHYSSNHLKQNV